MNTNSMSTTAVGLLGYLPFIEVAEGYKQHKDYQSARAHVLQTCIGYILEMIEAQARHGFKCSIGNTTMSIFPRVGTMSLDTVERVKYFGLKNISSCGICRRRKGRSATRSATTHCPNTIAELYTIANIDARTRDAQHLRKRARDQLGRHGLEYSKRCRVADILKHSLVEIPKYGPRLYGGLCRYERMHVYFIGYCTYCMELLIDLVPKAHYVDVHNVVKSCQQFRDPFTGRTHPRLPYLLKMTHLTAERRVRAIFYWAHVLGLQAAVIDQPCRLHAQAAVATLQLILIATRGHRAYTSKEMHVIYQDVGRSFFTHLEQLRMYVTQRQYERKLRQHQRRPEKFQAPTMWQKPKRFVLYRCNICTST